MLKPVPPCKDCDHRYLGCHAACKEYQDFVQANIEYAHMINGERYRDKTALDAQFRAFYEFKRKHK